jgi:dephospho-CoA kinase
MISKQSCLVVGLTGGIGSGKSSVTEMFVKLGITVIDADIIAHQLTLPGTKALLEISNQLGHQFITSQGELDRKKIAQFIFGHPDKKVVLENILHPRVRETIINELQKRGLSPYAILSIPLLLETNFTELVDRILVIDAPEEIRIQRVVKRDGRSTDDVKAIISHQVAQETRLKKADDILDNSGTIDELQSLVKQLHNQYLQISSEKSTWSFCE